jgi:hypothetical protein
MCHATTLGTTSVIKALCLPKAMPIKTQEAVHAADVGVTKEK